MNRYIKSNEPILAMAQIGVSRDTDKFSYCIYINPDAGRIGVPYFKFYDNKSYTSSEKVVRLGMKKYEKIYHKDRFDFWDINKQEAKVLDTFMSRKSKLYSNYTNWQVTMFLWNVESFFIYDAPDEYDTNIDAYFDGYYDTEKNLANSDYLPSTQPQIFYADWV